MRPHPPYPARSLDRRGLHKLPRKHWHCLPQGTRRKVATQRLCLERSPAVHLVAGVHQALGDVQVAGLVRLPSGHTMLVPKRQKAWAETQSQHTLRQPWSCRWHALLDKAVAVPDRAP